ncbi:hypothetical protein Q3G72_032404 [Acer saccharum]|nr:hypothetical protein Q3G72_032404 [Acer saccharum]
MTSHIIVAAALSIWYPTLATLVVHMLMKLVMAINEKALTVLRIVSVRIEKWWREEKRHEAMEILKVGSSFSYSISEEICTFVAKMANNLGVDALFVYTKTGHMASILSRGRPDCPIFAFTTTTSVRRRLQKAWRVHG